MNKIKKAISIILGISFVLSLNMNLFAATSSTGFADTNLENAVKQSLGKSANDSITNADITKLETLRANNLNISNLSGIEQCTNLTSLSLSGNNISNITLLSTLVNLTELNLSDNKIVDISPISTLTELSTLSLFDNFVENITPLKSLTQLSVLDLSSNQITDISSIEKLNNLTTLFLKDNEIKPLTLNSKEKTNLEMAQGLYTMGLYKGTSGVAFVPALDAPLTRAEGITMMLRFMGAEANAMAMTDVATDTALLSVTDRASIPTWAKKYIAYARVQKIVVGFPDGTVQVGAKLTGNQYATLILKAMGYTPSAFGVAAADLAMKNGGVVTEANAEITRGTAVSMSFKSLSVPISGAITTVIQSLINAGTVSEATAFEVFQ